MAFVSTRRYVSAYRHHRISKKGAMAMIDMERVFNQRLSTRTLNQDLNRSDEPEISINGRRIFYWLLIALLFSCPLKMRAQELAATLSGTISDTSGAVVPHAAVTITLNGVNGTGRLVEYDCAGNFVAT